MTTYYVRKTGSDGAAGTAAGTAWLTVDKAANTVAAGDTVYVGGGVFRELVTMDTAGSSGSPITFIGDVTGEFTGDAGLVIITAHDDDEALAARASCWDMNGKEFVVVKQIQFMGTTSNFVVGNTTNAASIAYEGCQFVDCGITYSGRAGTTDAVRIEVNNGATPTTNGLQFIRCMVSGTTLLHWDSNGTAMVNLKWLFEGCLFIGNGISSANAFSAPRQTNGGVNTIGGIKFDNCTFAGYSAAVNVTVFANTTNPCEMNNCAALFCLNIIAATTLTAGAFTARGNVGMGVSSAYNASVTQYQPLSDDTAILIGGIHDWILYKVLGWSPYRPWEPMALTVGGSYVNPLIDRAQIGDLQGTIDLHGNPRQLGPQSKMARIFYFDASDDAVTDPNNVWTNEANVADASVTTSATCASTGSTSSNFTFAGGTNAPSSGGTIGTVYGRIRASVSSGGTGNVQIFTDTLAASLVTISITNASTAWSSWSALSTPSGGWTWAKIQALEYKAYRTVAGTFTLFQIQVGVESAESAPDVGAVESRNRPIRTSGTVHAGTYASEFDGAGFHDVWVPVAATSTIITVYARYDSNYNAAVGNPKVLVLNIPGVADQSDTMSSGANTWEQLSCTFTPTSAGVVRVRLLSQDASTNGKCFFDDLARA